MESEIDAGIVRKISKRSIIAESDKPSCEVCGAKFSRKDSLNRHKRVHSGEKPFKCIECGGEFREKASLVQHSVVHSGKKPYSCEGCGSTFSDKSSLRRHVRLHSDNNPNKWTDPGVPFMLDSDLKPEPLTNDGEKPFKCGVCGSGFVDETALLTHDCGRTDGNDYGTQHAQDTNLNEHFAKNETENLYKCKYCEADFTDENTLLIHLTTHSIECNSNESAFATTVKTKPPKPKKTYKCEECGACMSYKSSFRRHKRVHTGVCPYECPVCGITFTRKHHLKHHFRKHPDKNLDDIESAVGSKQVLTKPAVKKIYQCNECGTFIKDRSAFRRHKRIHTGIKPHKCNECGTAFVRKQHLTEHVLLHSGEKPYKCDVCGCAFSSKSSLKRHVRIHMGDRPFKCFECKLAFIDKTSLQQHAHAVHANVNEK